MFVANERPGQPRTPIDWRSDRQLKFMKSPRSEDNSDGTVDYTSSEQHELNSPEKPPPGEQSLH